MLTRWQEAVKHLFADLQHLRAGGALEEGLLLCIRQVKKRRRACKERALRRPTCLQALGGCCVGSCSMHGCADGPYSASMRAARVPVLVVLCLWIIRADANIF